MEIQIDGDPIRLESTLKSQTTPKPVYSLTDGGFSPRIISSLFTPIKIKAWECSENCVNGET